MNEKGFRRAVKYDAKLRFAVCGPSGSGKTYTLLQLATELGGPVALVDTERGSASKYADLFEFDVLELESYDPARLIEIIDEAAEKGYRVLCIDSLSHFWIGKDGELDKVDRAARRMQNPNGFAAWKQVTPLHNALIDKIVSAPLHILASMRAKTEWILDRDERTGKTVPRKVGLGAGDARRHRVRVRRVRRHGPGEYAGDHQVAVPQTCRRRVPQTRQGTGGRVEGMAGRRAGRASTPSRNRRARLRCTRGAEEERRGKWRTEGFRPWRCSPRSWPRSGSGCARRAVW